MRRAEGWLTRLVCVLAVGLASMAVPRAWQVQPASWLDRPLINWNRAGGAVAKASLEPEDRNDLVKTCDRPLLRTTPGERALTDAGWIPFRNFDRQILQDGVEIIDGMAAADGMCRPWKFNVFVFVDGRFAGTLSPTLMNAREDAASSAVRILDRDTLSAEFERYTEKDPLCCPSTRVTVRYRIDRTEGRPLVSPLDVRVTRGQ